MSMLRFGAAVLASAFLATAANAETETYTIDSAHTHAQFKVMRFGFNNIFGEFRDVEGSIALDEAAPENSAVNVEIAIASVESGDDTRDGHLVGPLWFNAAEFPTMSFNSTAVKQHDETTATVTGDLTVHGVTKPVSLEVTLNKLGTDPATKKKAVGFSATTTIKRSDFGMETAMALIADDITIQIETLAHLAD